MLPTDATCFRIQKYYVIINEGTFSNTDPRENEISIKKFLFLLSLSQLTNAQSSPAYELTPKFNTHGNSGKLFSFHIRLRNLVFIPNCTSNTWINNYLYFTVGFLKPPYIWKLLG